MRADQHDDDPNLVQQQCHKYPIGKMFHLKQEIVKFVAFKEKNFGALLEQAYDNKDTNQLRTLNSIIKIWKQNQRIHLIPQNQLEILGKMQYDKCILQLLDSLQRRKNIQNHRICMTLTSIMRRFYMECKNQKAFINYNEMITHILIALKELILHHDDEFHMGENEFFRIKLVEHLIQIISNLIVFLHQNDGYKLSVFQQQKKKEQTKAEVKQIILQLILKKKCIHILYELFLYAKVDFAYFCYDFMELEIDRYEQAKKRQFQYQSLSKNQKMKKIIDNHWQQISKITHQLQFTTRSPVLCLTNVKILFYYLPLMLIQTRNSQQKIFVFFQLFSKLFRVLNHIYDQQNGMFFFDKYKKITVPAIQLIKAFRQTSFINHMQTALCSYKQSQIKQQKLIEEYQQTYQKVIQVFYLMKDYKQKVIKKIQLLYERFTFQFVFPFQQTLQAKQLEKLQQMANQQKMQQNPNQSGPKKGKFNLNNLSVPVADDGFEQNKPKRGRGKSKKQTKKVSFKKQMDQIQQQSDQDDENEKSKKIEQNQKKSIQKGAKNQKPHKFNLDADFSTQMQEPQEEMQMRPLPKNRLNIENQSPLQKPSVSNKSLTKADQLIIPQRERKVRFEPLKYLYYEQIVTYYSHHTDSYQSIELLKQKYIKNGKQEEQNPQTKFNSKLSVHYPQFLNRYMYKYIELSYLKQDNSIKLGQTTNIFYISQKQRKINIYRDIQHCLEKENMIRKAREDLKLKKTIQILEDSKDIIKEGLNSKRNNNTQFSFYQTMAPSVELNVQIGLFPLTETLIGQKMFEALYLSLQRFLYLYVNRQQRIRFGIANPFNKFNINIEQMFLTNYQIVHQDSLQYDLYFMMVFELILFIKKDQSFENAKNTKQFYQKYFKVSPPHYQAIVLYYMYEFERHEQFKFQVTMKRFVDQYLTATDIVKILKFLIKDCKIDNVRTVHYYKKLLTAVSNKVMAYTQMVNTQLFHIVNHIKPDQIKYTRKKLENTHSQEIPHSFNVEQKKRYLGTKFDQLVDMFHYWILLAGAAFEYDNFCVPQKCPIELAFFCKYCYNVKFIQVSKQTERLFQNIKCPDCNDGIIDRFELPCDQNMRQNRRRMVNQVKRQVSRQKDYIQQLIRVIDFNLQHLQLHKYTQRKPQYKIRNINTENIMEVEENTSNKLKQKNHHWSHYYQKVPTQRLSQRISKKDEVMQSNKIGSNNNEQDYSSQNNSQQNNISQFSYNTSRILLIFYNYMVNMCKNMLNDE